jgi:dienelactone hydrolase
MRRLSQVLAVIVGVGVAAVVLLLCAIGVQYWRNDSPIVLPRPRGPHPVGRTVFDWTDRTRSRELMVFAWYPARAGASAARAEYIPGKWGEAAAQGHFVIPARRMRAIQVSASVDAEVAPGPHPILVLLPAMGRAPAHYTTLAEDLASHGFIVAGIAPTGSTRGIVFPNGQTADSEIDPDQGNAEVDGSVMHTWLDDARFAVDRLLAGPPFAGSGNAGRVAVVGHSFGGAVAMQLLKTDSRFKVGANLDGSPWREPLGALARPLLILLSGRVPSLLQPVVARETAQLRAICDADRAGCQMHQYDQAGNADFTDDAVLPSRFPIPARLMDRGSVSGEQFQREVADKLLEFFGRSLVNR